MPRKFFRQRQQITPTQGGFVVYSGTFNVTSSDTFQVPVPPGCEDSALWMVAQAAAYNDSYDPQFPLSAGFEWGGLTDPPEDFSIQWYTAITDSAFTPSSLTFLNYTASDASIAWAFVPVNPADDLFFADDSFASNWIGGSNSANAVSVWHYFWEDPEWDGILRSIGIAHHRVTQDAWTIHVNNAYPYTAPSSSGSTQIVPQVYTNPYGSSDWLMWQATFKEFGGAPAPIRRYRQGVAG